MSDASEIANLLYRYAALWDRGDLEGAAALFDHAVVRRVRGDAARVFEDSSALLRHWREAIVIHADGTPRTRHVVTNARIAVDEAGGSAAATSYCTVFQQPAGRSLQPVMVATHRDRFERVHGAWRFSGRDYLDGELSGDLSAHVRATYRRR